MNISKLHRIIAWYSVLLLKLKFCQYQPKILEKQKSNFSHRLLFHRKTTVCLKYFAQDSLLKQYLASNSSPGPFKFDFFKNFGKFKNFNTVLTKNQATKLEKYSKNLLYLITTCRILSLRPKFGNKSLSSLVYVVFKKGKASVSQKMTVFNNWSC